MQLYKMHEQVVDAQRKATNISEKMQILEFFAERYGCKSDFYNTVTDNFYYFSESELQVDRPGGPTACRNGLQDGLSRQKNVVGCSRYPSLLEGAEDALAYARFAIQASMGHAVLAKVHAKKDLGQSVETSVD